MKGISAGIEDFKEAIETSYYIDKSQFIEHALNEKVCLLTRPRRFGKTLNMSMLRYFFDINEKNNAYLFDGLKITKNREMMKHQNKYPVISISLKRMEGASFEKAIEKYASILSLFLKGRRDTFDDGILIQDDQDLLDKYLTRKASAEELEDSLLNLSYILKSAFQ